MERRLLSALDLVARSLLALPLLLLPPLLAPAAAQVASAPFNVVAYGANGTDGTDDTLAFLAAIAAVPASGGEIYIPGGRYLLSQTLTVANKPIAFRGEGQRVSNLIWSGAIDGISFTSHPSQNSGFAVRGLSLLKRTGAGGAAIRASWPYPGSFAALGPVSATINDVHISTETWPLLSATHYWQGGMVLTNATNAKIHAFNIHMAGVGVSDSAVDIRGKSRNVQISDGDVSEMYRGVVVRDESESVHIKDVETGAVEYGFHLLNAGARSTITNCHSFGVNGIRVDNTTDVTITNNLIFMFPAPERNAIKIVNQLSAGARFRVIGNAIHGFFEQPKFGIVVEGMATDSVIQANFVSGVVIGIWLRRPDPGQPYAHLAPERFVVVGNDNPNPTVLATKNDGPNNYFADNR